MTSIKVYNINKKISKLSSWPPQSLNITGKMLTMTGFEPASFETGLEPAMTRSSIWSLVH